MMVEEFYNVIGTFGFPIFVCLWFMFRTEKIINRNTAALQEISKCMSKIIDNHNK